MEQVERNMAKLVLSGPHNEGSKEYAEIHKILKSESPNLRWQPILCRQNHNLQNHSIFVADNMDNTSRVFIASVPSQQDECRYILAMLVCHTDKSTMFIDLLCSSLKGSGVGSLLLDYAIMVNDRYIDNIKLIPTFESIEFYERKGFLKTDEFPFYMIKPISQSS